MRKTNKRYAGVRETEYSPEYRAWRAAIQTNNTRLVEEANRLWHLRHNTDVAMRSVMSLAGTRR